MRRRSMLLAATVAPFSRAALAQGAWPNRTVRFINPFTAGSAVDVVTRLITQDLASRLGQGFVVENRTGASGNLGTEAAARSRPDGYTFLAGSPGTMGINPFLFTTLPYDAQRDFVAVSHAVSFPQAVVVNPRLGIDTFPDLVAAARRQPGRLNYGSSGSGSTAHLAIELFRSALGLDIVHVPFRGGNQAVQAVISGDVQFAVEGVPSLPGLISQGLIRPLAVTSGTRSALLPDVPSVSETVPGYDAAAWIIYFAPQGTPAPIVEKLSEEIRISMNVPEVKARLAEQGATIFGRSPAETAAFHQAELAKWRRAVEISGARAD